jgi:beta-fructofuranosidase
MNRQIKNKTVVFAGIIFFLLSTGKSFSQSDEFNLRIIKDHIFAQHLYRDKLLKDQYRPVYHFVIPEGMAAPMDPNGAYYWKGRYHLFYIFQTVEPKPDYRGDAWAHISSHDLVHWRFHPTALKPGEDTPERAIYSGNMFLDKNDVPTIMYHGLGAGQCIAQSTGDDMLDTWERHKANPVIPYPELAAKSIDAEYRFFLNKLPDYGNIDVWDPHGWIEDDTYYAISGDNGTWPGKSGLYKSQNLEDWKTIGSFFHHDEVEGTLDCPDFFKLGDKYVLMFLRNGVEYIIGDWKNEQFYPEKKGTMTWNLGVDYAPESLVDDQGRRIMWAALNDSRSQWGNLDEVLPRDGWMGTLSMPRVLSLDDKNNLIVEPIEELKSLRHNHFHLEDLKISNEERMIEGVEGNTMELEIVIDPQQAEELGIKVLASQDGSEETVIRYLPEKGKIEVDLHKTSLNEELMENFYDKEKLQQADLNLKDGEDLVLRIFIDRSVMEVFINKRLCLTHRVYPTLDDNKVFIYSRNGAINVKKFSAWKMHPSNPY